MIELINKANSYSERTAIISNESQYSFDQLLSKSRIIASNILNGEKDLFESRVVFLINPSFEYVATQWAIWRAGGVAVPLCSLHPLPSLKYVIEDSEASILIISKSFKNLLKPLSKKLKIKLILIEEIIGSTFIELPEISIERRAMILYTSGTTSLPKGVVTTHKNIQFQIESLVEAWKWQSNDHILNILPLHHIHGIINVLGCALWSGACCEFLPKFDSKKVWEKISSAELTLFMAVPTIYFKLIDFWESSSKDKKLLLSRGVKKLRLMVSGSAALPVSVLEKWKEITSHILLERYGMTEIGMALSNSYEGERRPGHVGLPLPGVKVRLADSNGNEINNIGDSGEIQIKGPNVFKEYWNKPNETIESYQDGWFKSGDIAIFNNGMYKILGRDSVDIIKSGGYKISALEIEDVLRTNPNIKECAVIGLPDSEWGEIVAASLIIYEKKINFNDLKLWLKEFLPSYKIPRKYIIQKELPRNTLGKVKKNALKNAFD
ncbi:MAG: long-chain fatty acid--CoA ligase [Flavobacteriaceae bacterium]|nr:long-chain fatty acid--CoA ligase [Flavobacteriaceae bacterium]